MPLPEVIPYPEALPITARREEIVRLLRTEPVLVVAGETGSGKTTQLPKMALEAGLARGGRIACTQPRRVAATSVSRRVAEELGVDWGREVGCKVRFDDHTSRETRVKFLTDGMLLAEAQSDPWLRDYRCVIVDEAHERSLNIDFLLGHLNQLRRRRQDLSIIVTSATIDTARFSEAFGGAPVVEVSGRVYPVEVVYAPVDELLEESGEYTYIEAVQEAVERVLLESDSGDILVFLPTEKDIREACDGLEGRRLGVEVLPLFGRLGSADQYRVFAAQKRRKVVVATNIAETSLTIPGIRFVIDTGEARLSRYNPRTRTRRLPVEKISRASADQRKGRCGRVREGVCIRLYSEADYEERPRYTQPEIQRANLAEVILRMAHARLGEIETFPFIDPPSPLAVRSGYQLLEELGALRSGPAEEAPAAEEPEGGPSWHLTALGRELARLPIDPTVGRMVLQARREHALREVLVLASALSVQDPRERPAGEEPKADAAHRRFVHPDSDFLTLLQIWEAYHDEMERLTHSRLRRFCREHYLSFVRMREWMDLHDQLSSVLRELGGFRLEQSAPGEGPEARRWGGAFYRAVHRSLLPGLLANAARREEGNTFRAGGDRRVVVFPGSTLFRRTEPRRPGQPKPSARAPRGVGAEWIVCAEVVETTRLYARTCARIDPAWLLELGAHIIRRSHGDPAYIPAQARVVVRETARLHGLEVDARPVDYGRIAPKEATEIFIREALIGDGLVGNEDGPEEAVVGKVLHPRVGPHPAAGRVLPCIEANHRLVDKCALLRTRLRGGEGLALEEAAFGFYAKLLTPPVGSLHDLNRVLRERHGGDPSVLRMREEDLLGPAPGRYEAAAFPDSLPIANTVLPVHYAYRPGQDEDGVTVRVPVRRALDLAPGRLEWAVPAYRAEIVERLLRALPKEKRTRLQPLAERARELAERLELGERGLSEALAAHLREHLGLEVSLAELDLAALPAHLRVRVEVVDDDGRVLAAARDPEELRRQVDAVARAAASASEPELDRAWREARERHERAQAGSGPLPGLDGAVSVAEKRGVAVVGWLGLRAETQGAALRLFRSREEAAASTSAGGWEKLAEQHLRHELAYVREDARDLSRLGVLAASLGPGVDLREQAVECLRRHLCARLPEPWTREGCERRLAEAKAEARGITYKLIDQLKAVLEWRLKAQIARHPYPALAADIARLTPSDLLLRTPYERLPHLVRYLRAVLQRAEKHRLDPGADAERARRVKRYEEALALRLKRAPPPAPAAVEELRWLLEEFRVSVFAQALGTAEPVSEKRLDAKLAALG